MKYQIKRGKCQRISVVPFTLCSEHPRQEAATRVEQQYLDSDWASLFCLPSLKWVTSSIWWSFKRFYEPASLHPLRNFSIAENMSSLEILILLLVPMVFRKSTSVRRCWISQDGEEPFLEPLLSHCLYWGWPNTLVHRRVGCECTQVHSWHL